MRLRKLLLGAGVITFALAISAGFGIQSASANEDDNSAKKTTTAIGVKDISVSYERQCITVIEGIRTNTKKLDNKLYVGIGSYNPKSTTDVKVKKWTEYDYDETGVIIDISSLSVTKVQYVVIKGDVNTDEVAIRLAATPSKLAASIDYTDPAAPALVLNNITKGKANAVAVSNVEFATANGAKFKTYNAATSAVKDESGQVTTEAKSGTDLTKFQKLGATLKVRQAATDDVIGIDATNDDKDKRNASTVSIKLNGTDTTAYRTLGNFASKEYKVKIAKLAAGPRISINYVKNTISVPKTAEYRTKAGEKFENEIIKDSPGKKTVVVSVGEFNAGREGTVIDIRTAAKVNTSDVTKSKSASNITEVKINNDIGMLSCKTVAADGTVVNIDENNFATADLENIIAEGKVTFKYGTKAGTATFTNEDADNAYEIYVSSDSELGYSKDNSGNNTSSLLVPSPSAKGAKKLAAGVGKTLKLKKLKDGDKIFIRKPGNAKKKIFATSFTPFGTVKFPTATATPAPTASAGADAGTEN